jgi:hypothetical protein
MADVRVLDWHIAPSEEHTHWEVLLNRLWRRGVQPEKGVKTIVRDGCGGVEEAIALVYGPSVLDQRCMCAQTPQCRNQSAQRIERKRASRETQASHAQKPATSIKLQPLPRRQHDRTNGHNDGKDALPMPLPYSNAILRPLWCFINSIPSHGSGYAQPLFLNVPIEPFAPNFVRR